MDNVNNRNVPRRNDNSQELGLRETYVMDAIRQQRGYRQQQTLQMETAFASLWQDSGDVVEHRAKVADSLNSMQRLTQEGVDFVRETRARISRQLDSSQARLEQMSEQQSAITQSVVQCLNARLMKRLHDPAMEFQSEEQVRASQFRYQADLRAIAEAADEQREAVVSHHARETENSRTLMLELGESVQLHCSMLQSHINVQTTFVSNISRHLKEEYDLKFRVIGKAINFILQVQQQMLKHAEMVDKSLDQEAARQLQKTQQEAAHREAMTKLDMSHEQARRAAALLENKEYFSHQVKREELALERLKTDQDHARRSKRYFSLWDLLFR